MTRAPIRSTGRSAVASSIGADTATTAQTPAAEAVTIREPRAATWATAAGGTTVRPRRPCGRSRADHAVTASRSRSMRNWSGTSMAMAGTNRAASVAASSSRLHTTCGSACSSAPAPVTRNNPTPTTIQTRSASSPWTSRARATPAATAATSAATPTTVGSRSGSGAHTTANAAAAANAGAATIRWALSRPIGSTPRNAEKPSSPTVSRPSSLSSPPARDPNHAGQRRDRHGHREPA